MTVTEPYPLTALPVGEYQPTMIERNTYAALDTLGIRYYRQYPLGNYTADAYLPDYAAVIECDGCYFHACPECGYYLTQVDEAHEKYERTIRRDNILRTRFGLRTIRIWGHHLLTPEAALATVQDILAHYLTTRRDATRR